MEQVRNFSASAGLGQLSSLSPSSVRQPDLKVNLLKKEKETIARNGVPDKKEFISFLFVVSVGSVLVYRLKCLLIRHPEEHQ